MTRVIGSLVVKNESDRYLESCIRHAQTFLDEIFVYDDISTDNSVEICRDLGCNVLSREPFTESFLEHEGLFRFNAWRAFERTMNPVLGDWVFSFDADEFMVSTRQPVDQELEFQIQQAKKSKATGIILPFPEIFDIKDGNFYSRMDGLWAKVMGPRLFAYQHGATWNDKVMGCGSEPLYVVNGKKVTQNRLHVLHLGYARASDRQSKYDRYTSLAKHGHNDKHIASIIKKPTLRKWAGPVPEVFL